MMSMVSWIGVGAALTFMCYTVGWLFVYSVTWLHDKTFCREDSRKQSLTNQLLKRFSK